MKTRNLIIFGILAITVGCAPSTSTTANGSFTNTDAEYSANVSGIYELAAYGSVGSWTGVDIKWKDSSGIIRAMSAYGDSGKPVVLSFWVTSPDTGAWEEPALDSVQSNLGDSVGIVTVAEDITSNSFDTVFHYVKANKITIQVVIDTGDITHIEYADQVNPSLALPETFIMKPNGTIMKDTLGYVSVPTIDSLVRAAY
jgi:hypothetical protein